MAPSFNHINLAEQAALGSCTTAILASGAVTSSKINIDSNISFNEFQALQFRIENLTSTPSAGHPGRLIFRTDLDEVLIDTGSSFISVAAVAGVSSLNSLTNAITLAAGSGITITPSGQTLTFSSTGGVTTGNLTEITSDVLVITNGTGAVVGSGTTIDVKKATTSQDGYISSTDWNVFNNKQPTLTIGSLTDTGTDGISVTGGVGAVIGSGASISQHVADSTHNGYLASSDWTTFNNKQPAGSYITALTGDVTATGPGSSVATLSASAAVKSIHADANTNLTGNVQLVSGTNVTLSQVGQVITVNSTGGGLTSANFVVGETPSGSVNGINTNYTLAHTPTVGTVSIYLNGVRQRSGAGNDYTISGAAITFSVAPHTGDILLADYMM